MKIAPSFCLFMLVIANMNVLAQPTPFDGHRYLLLADTVVGSALPKSSHEPMLLAPDSDFSFDVQNKKTPQGQRSVMFREPSRMLASIDRHYFTCIPCKDKLKANPSKEPLWDIPLIMAAELLSPKQDGGWGEHLDRFRERQMYPDFFWQN